jgi:hypothetical protein
MMGVNMNLEDFVYNDKDSYINNFHRWYCANTMERECYKEPKLSIYEAESKFQKMWGYKKFEDKVFVN